jgi:hypothetical protein
VAQAKHISPYQIDIRATLKKVASNDSLEESPIEKPKKRVKNTGYK